MRDLKRLKRAVCGILAAGVAVSASACGNKVENYYEPGVVNTDTSQTEFTIMGGISALSSGYEDNEVLNQMQKDAGIGAKEDYNIYQFPQFAMINKAWLDELDMEVPTTLDELRKALEAFEEHDMATYYGNEKGSTIPMSTGFDQWCWGQNIFYAGFGFTNWPNDVINDLQLKPDGSVDFVCADEKYRDALTYFHDWYDEGLMDVEMFSQDDKQYMAKCQQGKVGVGTWWWFDLWGEHKDDYVYLPVLDGPDGTHNVTLRSAPPLSCGNLSITSACKSPANLLKFFDQWYDPENVMQLQYGPIGTYFTGQDKDAVWQSITEEDAQEKFGKSVAELKGVNEVYGPKLILSDYYGSTFALEDAAVIRLTDLYETWMPFVEETAAYPTDCVFTEDELDVIDRYKTDFENAVSEQEGLWIKEGGPSDEKWEAYLKKLKDACGMDELRKVYQDAYGRYLEAKAE